MVAQALFSSKEAEHYTPGDIADAANVVLRGINLDPASCGEANTAIGAHCYYTANDDGLSLPWFGPLWLNPPFSVPVVDEFGQPVLNDKGNPKRSRVIHKWVERWRKETSSAGNVKAALLLVPARTDTNWFQPLFGSPMCFIGGRLKFGDAKDGAPFPTAIIYRGNEPERFAQVFKQFGRVGQFLSIDH